MKLALVAPTPIPANTANSIQFMKMAQAFSRLGHELKIFAPGAPPLQSRLELIEHYGLGEDMDITWIASSMSMRRYDYAYLAVKEAKRWRTELIYSRLPQAAAWAALRGIPTIFELHDMPGGEMGPRFLNLFLRARGGRRLVLISAALAAAVTERYPRAKSERMLVAQDAVDLERYEDLPKPADARTQLKLPQSFTAGYTGHLYAGRGIGFILDLAEKTRAIRFLLVGGRREDVGRVAREIDRRELSNVTLTGFIANAQLPLYQAASDVLLMPYERRVAASSGGNIAAYLSPMKMFEYLASGRPILTSDLPVLAEVLNSENAVVLSMNDLASWVEALSKLRKDKRLRARLSSAARATAADHSWESRAKRILADL